MVELHSTTMVHTKQTKCRYQTREEEEMAKRRMEEEAKKSGKRKSQELEEEEIVDTEESGQTGKSQEAGIAVESQETGMAKEDTGPEKKKRKKDKKDKKSMKSMTKEKRQKKSEELKTQKKRMGTGKEETEKEKAGLKREEHKMLLEKTHALLQRNTPAAAARSATATTISAEIHPAPPRTEPTEDPLETSLVESGPLLVSLNQFEGEDEPVIRPTLGAYPGAATILTETIHVESSTERLLEAAGGAPKKSSGEKAPQKQAIPKRNRKTPGSGALRYPRLSISKRQE